jgi:transglutaminase-like putative cysteine protease
MAIRVALQHRTSYKFDRLVNLGPHEIRLRPAPHCRTPVLGYSLDVEPATHFMNWQQDPYGNWIARLVFPERTEKLQVVVDLTADMTVINPFDFFVEAYAEQYPFEYSAGLAKELLPFLETEALTPRLGAWLDAFGATLRPQESTVGMLVRLNHQLRNEIRYLVRMEPGVQAPEQTLERACGSCRDTGWLLVQILRRLGLAARFVSGYLIQLKADVKPLDGPAGAERDFTDLHAWAEAYLPGAGWVGLDPTSGLLAGEGHIPLACTADPGNAAPVIGFTDVCEVEFDFAMKLSRVHRRAMNSHRRAGREDRCRLAGQRRPPHAGRRADLRFDRRHGRGRMEYRGAGHEKARAERGADATAQGSLRTWSAAALRAGQVVSGRTIATLVARRSLAQGRRTSLAQR